MLVLDGHGSYMSPKFDAFCKEKNIITLCMPPHSSHLLQPLNVRCFSLLKVTYSREISDFVKYHINYITKLEFLIVFRKAFFVTFSEKNCKAGFKGSSLVPYNPKVVLSNLNVKLQIPIPTKPPPAKVDP